MVKTPHPLDGARLKLSRAKRHFNGLGLAVKRFKSHDPYEIIGGVETESDGTSYYVLRFREHRGIPPSFGLIIGDICTNLRAALEYSLWQLHESFNPKLKEGDRFYFPISDSADSFQANGMNHGGLKRLPADKWALIEDLQPYKTGDDYLPLLARLNNADKHRIIPVIALSATLLGFELAGMNLIIGPGETAEIGRIASQNKPIVDGAELARVSIGSVRPEEEMHMRNQVAANFVFGEEPLASGAPRLVGITIHRIIQAVEGALDHLKQAW